MRPILWAAALFTISMACNAQNVWKCEQNGSISYKNIKKDTAARTCTQMADLDNSLTSIPAKVLPTVKITPESQKNRDMQRKKLLEHELFIEEQSLGAIADTSINKEQRDRHARNIVD